MEPHYEDGTFNACTSCNQRYLKKALENGERYIFFFTKYVGRDKDLREKFGKKYCITGYYEISGMERSNDGKFIMKHYNNTGKAVKCEDPHFYSMEDSYPLEKIDAKYKSLPNPRYARKHLSVEDTEKILKHFSGKKNRILDYRRETKNLYL